MATFDIGPSDTYTIPNAALYAAMTGGSTRDIIRWDAGFIYRPTAGSWWGLSGGGAGAMDKAAWHQITGGSSVVIDGRIVYAPGSLASEPTLAYQGDGIWYWDLYSAPDASIPATDTVTEMFVGAATGVLVSEFVAGWQYMMADSLVNVDSTGTTVAGMIAGKGIWFGTKFGSGGTRSSRVYVWTGSASITPDIYWDGIAFSSKQSGAAVAGPSPRYSPFVLRGSASNNASTTIVEAGFIIAGTPWCALGSPPEANTVAGAGAIVSNVAYHGVEVIGGFRGIYLGSDTATTTVGSTSLGGFTVDENSIFDDRIDPAYYPARPGDGSNSHETVSIESRVKNFTIRDTTIRSGNTHGSINFACDETTDAEVQSQNLYAANVECYCRDNAGYARGLTLKNSLNGTVYNCLFQGYTVQSQVGGTGTLLYQSTWRLGYENYNDVQDSHSYIQIRTFDEGDPSTVTVKLYRNTFDRRGDAGRGVTEAWSCVEVRASTSGGLIAANTLDARGNVTLGDAGTVGVWVTDSGGQVVDKAQRWTGNWRNFTNEAAYTPAPGSAQGTAYASAGSVFTPGGTTDGGTLTADPLSHPNRPTNRYGSISLAE
mgnify:CR=1 FL=1